MTTSRAFVAVCVVVLAGLAFEAQARPSSQPSFNCKRAASWVEQAICADPVLAAKDRAAAYMYMGSRATMQEYGDSEETYDLKREKRQWLAQRNACTTVPCLQASYDARLRRLQDPDDPRTLDAMIR